MADTYVDLHTIGEDERIDIIGRCCTADGLEVAFIVDSELKADWYLIKLRARFKIRLIARVAGPVPGTVCVRVGPPES